MSRATGRRLSIVVGMTPVPASTRMAVAVVATKMVEEEEEVKEVAKWEAAVAVTVVAAMTMVVAMTVAVTMGVVMEALKEVTVVAREVTVVAKAAIATAVIVIHSVFSAVKFKVK